MNKPADARSLEELQQRFPLLKDINAGKEAFWLNPALASLNGRRISGELGTEDIDDAEKRLERFAPYLALAFPETAPQRGVIESALAPVPRMRDKLAQLYGTPPLEGGLYLKLDGELPISGSVKARGGIYEVLKTAESVAEANGLLPDADSYAQFASEPFRRLFSGYKIVVGSTGNLGLSIGIMSARLGFQATVHMSSDAKQWKKDLLRAKGATVIEHAGDYGEAVATGRREALADPKSHFVDDENSRTLFLGYAVAAKRLQRQLREMDLEPGPGRPLFVYLPCGVGGAPGGITFGLRSIFSDAAHCFFAEPVQSPAMLLGLMTGMHNEICVEDVGLTNRTEADGLAVGRPSGFIGKVLKKDVSGVFTVNDDRLHQLLALLAGSEGFLLEPSAMAGFPGPVRLLNTPHGRAWLEAHGLAPHLENAVHIVWGTGGGMVPPEIMSAFRAKGEALLRAKGV